MTIGLRINGEMYPAPVRGEMPLALFLRETLGLRGTKIGCGAGECGACTVLLEGAPVCSCLVPVGRCEGLSVRTIEGLASAGGVLHPVQQALVDHGAFQCGFCTPGMVMTVLALAEKGTAMTDDEIGRALQGNVCRCSGYVLLVDAVRSILARLAR